MDKELMAEQIKEMHEGVEKFESYYQKELDSTKERLEKVIAAQDQMIAKGRGFSLNPGGTAEVSLMNDIGNALNESANLESLKKFISGEKRGNFEIQTKDMALTTSYTGGTVALNTTPIGIVGAFNRKFHLRDVLSKQPMDTGTIPIIKDNGNTGSFTTVAEGGTKPVIDFSLAESPAKAQVIAAISNVTRQFLDDLGIRGVVAWLQSRLTELYLNAEDDQILNGNGVSPNLAGLNLAGNFTAATSLAAANDVVQLVTSLVQMRTLLRTPTAIIVHPTNLLGILLNQSAGSLEFDLPAYVKVTDQGGISILGVPIIDTVGQAAGTFDILDTNQMLQGIRENFNIRFFEQDGTNVQTNKITVRAEARIAFATYGAANCIKGTF